MKRLSLIAAIVIVVIGHASASDVEVTIRFFDKRIYYTEASSGPIYVQMTLSNRGADTFRFKLADERGFSLDFDVRTTANRALDPSEILIRKRKQDQLLFFREVALEPGESFSFHEDLRSYVSFPSPGAYIVRASFYPELRRTLSENSTPFALLSNYLNLNINPRPLIDSEIPSVVDIESGALLARERLPPDEVVAYTLNARQKNQWEKYFLYLDLESLLTRDPSKERAWRAESEEGRQGLLERYREDLKASIVDGDISIIPIDFEIQRTSYGGDEGSVSVIEYFRYGNLTERKLYTYYLRKMDGLWVIYDYTVVNLAYE